MNKVILCGRLTGDPTVTYTTGAKSIAVGKYTLAVDRRGKKDGSGQTADFISCVAFDKAGEFAEKYFRKGIKIIVTGRIQTGSYPNKEDRKVYTTDVIVEDQEFAESKAAASGRPSPTEAQAPDGDGFVYVPDDASDEMPFN